MGKKMLGGGSGKIDLTVRDPRIDENVTGLEVFESLYHNKEDQ